MSPTEHSENQIGRPKEDEGNVIPGGGDTVTLRSPLSAGRCVSRRHFTKGISRIIGLGALSHFSLLVGNALGADGGGGQDCPGGGDADDYCMPGVDPDKCPGEQPPYDYCDPEGSRESDECSSGSPIGNADICDESVDPNTDQCQSGNETDDKCSGFTPPSDQCPTGQSPDDACPPKGTDAMGDQCPGGGAANGLDICDPEGSGPTGGDDCSRGSWGLEDDCNELHPDQCAPILNLTDDDSCPNGTNVGRGENGGDDWCLGNVIASDDCGDGTDNNDRCLSNETNNGAYDACPGGDSTVDQCTSTSDDVCFGTATNNDECHPEWSDADECPGGMPPQDECPTGDPPEDECTAAGGCAGGDQENGYMPPDECRVFLVDACTLTHPDHNE